MPPPVPGRDCRTRPQFYHLFAGALLSRNFQYWLEQSEFRIANRKLRSVHSYRNASGPGGQVIARQSTLPPLVQFATGLAQAGARG